MRRTQIETVLNLVGDGAYTTDLERRIQFWNPAAEKITGYSSAEVLGKKCSDNILRHVTAEGEELCLKGCPLQATIEDGLSREIEVYLHHKDGYRVPVFVRSAALHSGDGPLGSALEIFSDRSDTSSLMSELETLRRESLRDPLTGLGNRRYLEIMAETRFAAYKAEAVGFGLLLLDIDRFKRINDEHGHLAGDRVLSMVGKTILGAIRPVDSAVRYGGEEFVILVPNCDRKILEDIAERIRSLVAASWLDLESGSSLSVTVSIGGATVRPQDGLESLLERADGRMYVCKETGRNRTLVGD
ncbi:MAG TPA: sensor domain-containing diguanylate cyclase [Rectinemataceae bacterium]